MSDTSDRNIVIMLYIFVYLYIVYIQIKINIKHDWNNKKCNPISMITASFFQTQDESAHQFENCIKNLSRGVVAGEIKEFKDAQQDNYKEFDDNTKKKLDTIDTNITTNSRSIEKKYDTTIEKVAGLEESVTGMNNNSNSIPSTIERYTTTIKDLFKNIRNYVNK